MNMYRIFSVAAVSLAVLVEPALAGVVRAPGPIAGVGVSALAVIGGVYWVGRKLFAGKK